MYTISKDFSFSASHQLLALPYDHPCARLHGHNYKVRIHLSSPTLNNVGFIRDYRELNILKEYIDKTLDHRHLNDIFGDHAVTAEHLSYHLFLWCHKNWPETSAVAVSETPKTWATYTKH